MRVIGRCDDMQPVNAALSAIRSGWSNENHDLPTACSRQRRHQQLSIPPCIMPKNPLKSPDLFINRELSWLEFNHRVLQEGLDADLPLLERLKFLAIVGSNLDEFFLVRVAWLMQRRAAKVRRRDLSGMTADEQLAAIGRRAHRMVEEQSAGVREVFARLAEHGLRVWNREEWTDEHRRFAEAYFAREIEPILTPLAIQRVEAEPAVAQSATARGRPARGRRGARGQSHFRGDEAYSQDSIDRAAKIGTVPDGRIVVVPVPSQLPRWVTLAVGVGNARGPGRGRDRGEPGGDVSRRSKSPPRPRSASAATPTSF